MDEKHTDAVNVLIDWLKERDGDTYKSDNQYLDEIQNLLDNYGKYDSFDAFVLQWIAINVPENLKDCIDTEKCFSKLSSQYDFVNGYIFEKHLTEK